MKKKYQKPIPKPPPASIPSSWPLPTKKKHKRMLINVLMYKKMPKVRFQIPTRLNSKFLAVTYKKAT